MFNWFRKNKELRTLKKAALRTMPINHFNQYCQEELVCLQEENILTYAFVRLCGNKVILRSSSPFGDLDDFDIDRLKVLSCGIIKIRENSFYLSKSGLCGSWETAPADPRGDIEVFTQLLGKEHLKKSKIEITIKYPGVCFLLSE